MATLTLIKTRYLSALSVGDFAAPSVRHVACRQPAVKSWHSANKSRTPF
jgi:hypothetical protein